MVAATVHICLLIEIPGGWITVGTAQKPAPIVGSNWLVWIELSLSLTALKSLALPLGFPSLPCSSYMLTQICGGRSDCEG